MTAPRFSRPGLGAITAVLTAIFLLPGATAVAQTVTVAETIASEKPIASTKKATEKRTPIRVGVKLPKSMYTNARQPKAVPSTPRKVGAALKGTTVLDAGGRNKESARVSAPRPVANYSPAAASVATSGNGTEQRAQSASPKPLFPGGPTPKGSGSGTYSGGAGSTGASGTVGGSAGGGSAGGTVGGSAGSTGGSAGGTVGGSGTLPKANTTPPPPPPSAVRTTRVTNVNRPVPKKLPSSTVPNSTLPNTAPPPAPAQLPGIAGAPPETFAAALAAEYKFYIQQEYPKFKHKFRRAHFLSKAGSAAGGTNVAPENFINGAGLNDARARLVAAMDGNARTTAPALAARAQRLYDCWAERVRMGALEDDVLMCRNAFFSTLMWVEDAVQPVKGVSPFNQSLAQGYLRYANVKAAEDKDFIDARYFATKGLGAGEGGNVQPELIARWNLLKDGETPEFLGYRERLMWALDNGGRANLPAAAARAQVSFDCWVESTSEHNGPGAKRRETCRAAFLAALQQLEGRDPTQAGYLVFFDFDSIRIKPEGRRTIRAAAMDIKRRGVKNVTVVGHADRAGPAAYNLRLSERRANVIKRALTRQGIPARNIKTIARGESQNAVPTADGVRNPKNRRGQIIVP